MVRRQIARRGVADARVLAAMEAVPRERFVPAALAPLAYADGPVPIGEGQTVSQPFVVAWMAELLRLSPGDRVLEVGTGSGYGAAVLSRLAGSVFTVERRGALAAQARSRLAALHCDNVHVRVGDGSLGWPEHAPFDAISVAAGGPRVPAPLRDQLKVGGRLAMPVGSAACQTMIVERKGADGACAQEALGAVRFVPLVGADGWPEDAGSAGEKVALRVG